MKFIEHRDNGIIIFRKSILKIFLISFRAYKINLDARIKIYYFFIYKKMIIKKMHINFVYISSDRPMTTFMKRSIFDALYSVN